MRIAHLSSVLDRTVISVQLFPMIVLLMRTGQAAEVGVLSLGILLASLPTAVFSSFVVHPMILAHSHGEKTVRTALLSRSFSHALVFSFLCATLAFAVQSASASPWGTLLWVGLSVSALNCLHEFLIALNRLEDREHQVITANTIALCAFSLLLAQEWGAPQVTLTKIVQWFLLARAAGVFTLLVGTLRAGLRPAWQTGLTTSFRAGASNFIMYLSLFALSHGHLYLISFIYGAKPLGLLCSLQALFRPITLLTAGDQHFRLLKWAGAQSDSREKLTPEFQKLLIRTTLCVGWLTLSAGPLHEFFYQRNLELDVFTRVLVGLTITAMTFGNYLYTFLVSQRSEQELLWFGTTTAAMFLLLGGLAFTSWYIAISLPLLTVLAVWALRKVSAQWKTEIGRGTFARTIPNSI